MEASSQDRVAAVELERVSRQFGSRVILDRIDLSIATGEYFALVGPSGSGKSTLLKMVSGIEAPDSGRVLLRGRDVTSEPPYRRPVHTVFQSYALFPHLSVEDNVGFPLRVAGVPRRERRARAQRVLSWVKLESMAGRRITDLSGGERQRVAVARALVDDPQCVLLDEPLSALDPHLRSQTLDLLQEIQARLGVTYLYVTHDREEALRAAHRIAILREGHLEQVGAPADVYQRPTTPFVASFLGAINWLAGHLQPQDDRPGVRLGTGEWLPLPLEGRARDSLPAGSGVKVGVRPEAVRLVESGGLLARIQGRQFAGAFQSVRLVLGDETALSATLGADQPVPAVGSSCRIDWAPEALHVFAAEEK